VVALEQAATERVVGAKSWSTNNELRNY
jgi:hypothetical protein